MTYLNINPNTKILNKTHYFMLRLSEESSVNQTDELTNEQRLRRLTLSELLSEPKRIPLFWDTLWTCSQNNSALESPGTKTL